jgi:hypothetical protein
VVEIVCTSLIDFCDCAHSIVNSTIGLFRSFVYLVETGHSSQLRRNAVADVDRWRLAVLAEEWGGGGGRGGDGEENRI